MKITEKLIDSVVEKFYKKALDLVYGKPDYEAIEKYLRFIVKDLDYPELNKMHIVKGMRELRAINTTYELINMAMIVRTKVWCEASVELEEHLTETEQTEYDLIKNINGCLAAIFPNGDFAIINPPVKHSIINDEEYTGNMMLHNDNGPSILFEDGSALYTLWDIDVDEKWVMTPVEDIKIDEVLAIPNVDQRAVVMRRIGVENFVKQAEIIDTDNSHPHGPYNLIDLGKVLNRESAKYLEMTCPSTGNHHVEGVSNECKTVQEAINWRAKVSQLIKKKDR